MSVCHLNIIILYIGRQIFALERERFYLPVWRRNASGETRTSWGEYRARRRYRVARPLPASTLLAMLSLRFLSRIRSRCVCPLLLLPTAVDPLTDGLGRSNLHRQPVPVGSIPKSLTRISSNVSFGFSRICRIQFNFLAAFTLQKRI